MKKIIFVILSCWISFAVFGQVKPTMAILPFTGGSGDEGETLAELFSFDYTLTSAFMPLPRTSINTAINREQNFQMDSGYTNPETISRIGRQLGAKYILAGSIAEVGGKKLIIVTIMQIENLQLIAGEWKPYSNVDEFRYNRLLEFTTNIIPDAQKDTSKLQKLAVLPFQMPTGKNEADTLAQILAVEIAQHGVYAVYPRTRTLEQVQREYNNQLNGNTADEYAITIGKGDNPLLAMSVVARDSGNNKRFNAAVINVESGGQVNGKTFEYHGYNSLGDDTLSTIREIALQLGGGRKTVKNYTVFNSQTFYDTINDINKKIAGVYTITLTGNITVDRNIDFLGNANKFITIKGDGRERSINYDNTYGKFFDVPWEIFLTLDNNLILNSRGGGILVHDGGRLKMEGGTINATGFDDGVSVNGSNSQFSMKNGNIKGVRNGVSIGNGGTFSMENGTISGCESSGVSVDKDGTFYMSGGTISGNSGGGVSVTGSFVMRGGAISNNTKNGPGGGVCVLYGTFTMSGGTISGNSATGTDAIGRPASGGGVVVMAGNFNLQETGIISNNIANGTGGGVSVQSGVFIKIGGTIEANNKANRGGNVVYVESLKQRVRNSAAGPSVYLDSQKEGAAGGWE